MQSAPCMQVHIKLFLPNARCMQVHINLFLPNAPCMQIHIEIYMQNAPCMQVHITIYIQSAPCTQVHTKLFLPNAPCMQVHIKLFLPNAPCMQIHLNKVMQNAPCVQRCMRSESRCGRRCSCSSFSSFDRHSCGSYAIYIWSNPLRRLLRHTSSRPVVNPDSLIIYLTSVSPNTYPPPAQVPSEPLVCIRKFGGAGRKVAQKSRPVSGHEIATHNAWTQYWVHALCVAILRPESGHHFWST